MVLGLAAGATCVLLLALLPMSSLRVPAGASRRVAALTVLLTAWPLSCTFLFGPLVFGASTPAYYPVIWFGPAMVTSFTILVRNLNERGSRPHVPAMMIGSVSALTLLAVVLTPKNSSDTIRWAMAAVLLSGTLFAAERVSAEAIAVGCRLALAAVSGAILVAVIANPAVVTDCRADKCGIAGRVLTSPFAGNGNILGLYAAMLLPFALYRATPIKAVLSGLGVVAVCELAGSRSALIGVAVVAIGYALLLVCDTSRSRMTAMIGLLAACTAASLVPAVIRYGDEAFTFRGALWNQAKDFIAARPVFGSGPTAWERFGLTSVADANYSPHNLWLDMAVSVGVWGLGVVAAAMIVLIVRSDAEDREAILLYLCGVLAIGTLESLFIPYFVGIAPFVALLPLFIGGRRSLATDGPQADHGPSSSATVSMPCVAPAAAVTTSGDTWKR